MSKELTTAANRREDIKNHIQAVIGKEFPKERFAKMALIALSKNEKLAQAPWALLLLELVSCARMGLIPDGNEATITTFWNKKKGINQPQLMPMIQGLMKIAERSEKVKSIAAHLVYSNEVFWIKRDYEGMKFEHESCLTGDRGDCIGVYAVAYMRDAPTEIEFMNKDEVEVVRAKAISGAWGAFWGEMAKKTVMRRLIKRLPKNPHLDEFVEVDNRNFGPIEEPTIEAPKEGDYKKKLQEAVTQDNAPFEVEGPDTMEGGHGRAMEEMLGGKQENRNRSEYDT